MPSLPRCPHGSAGKVWGANLCGAQGSAAINEIPDAERGEYYARTIPALNRLLLDLPCESVGYAPVVLGAPSEHPITREQAYLVSIEMPGNPPSISDYQVIATNGEEAVRKAREQTGNHGTLEELHSLGWADRQMPGGRPPQNTTDMPHTEETGNRPRDLPGQMLFAFADDDHEQGAAIAAAGAAMTTADAADGESTSKCNPAQKMSDCRIGNPPSTQVQRPE